MELWDAYLEDETLAGCDLVRGEEIPKGLYHLVSEVLVRHTDGSFLLMQRDLRKPNYPGLYEATAGGSALKNENAYDAAVRELEEETGIHADSLKLIYECKSSHAIYKGYLCETDCNKDEIRLQEGETISFLWLEKEEFLEFVESDKYVEAHRNRLNEFIETVKSTGGKDN